MSRDDPPDDPPEEPRFGGNARQRRKALRALWGRCPVHGGVRKKNHCVRCGIEEAHAEAESERSAAEYFALESP